ncbi:MAG: glycosyltransferase family 87 protein [Candidatus Binatia bacterium]
MSHPAACASGATPAPALRLLLPVAIAGFVCVVSALSYRAITNLNVPGHPHDAHWALQDFRDAVYYPVVSLLAGHNPYDAAAYTRTYPVRSSFPLYSPLTLLIHLPFGLLPYRTAEAVYYALTLVLTVVLARLTLNACGLASTPARVLGLAALLLISRPGQMNLLGGQTTVAVVIGAYAALHLARTRPWLAGLGLALSTLKPTFGLPLTVLLLARRDIRPVRIGWTIGGILAGGVVAVLVHNAGGVEPFLASLGVNSSAFLVNPANQTTSSISRLDALALLGRLLGRTPALAVQLAVGLGILGLGAFVVHRLADNGRDERAQHLSAAVVCLTVLTCTYHQAYDLLLLAWPVTALAAGRWKPRPRERGMWRWTLLALLAFPAGNYLTSATVIDTIGITGIWWTAVASLNGAALLAALSVCTLRSLSENR